jgi:uncharacterized protein
VRPPRILADEMVGTLARYLRMMGCDTTYARGWTDDEIVRRARAEARIVITRDRQLSARASPAILLTSPRLEDQVRTTWAAFPEWSPELRFERCTVCNGTLQEFRASESSDRLQGVPWDRVKAGLPLYRCADCGHLYWDGSHTDNVRRRLRQWAERRPG